MALHIDNPLTVPTPGRPGGGSGLAITALVLAVISLLLCWVPIVNNVVFFLGLVALAFAVPALVLARKGRRSGGGMALASVIVAVLSLVGVLATQAFYVSVIDDVANAVEDSADGVVTPTENEQEEIVEAQEKPLGTSAAVGDEYTVQVDAVDLNVAKVIAAANEFNEPADGQYVLVDLTVQYTGSEEGDPWLDLNAVLVGSDARQYSTSTCSAVVPHSSMDVPTLENGGKSSYQVCFDVPPAALTGAKLFVEESLSLSESRVYWSMPA